MSSIMLKKRNARLRREYEDLLSCPIANCSAAPLENDIGTWHANICVESLNIIFHFEIKYPSDYPNCAPKVKPFTTIKHPNVFGTYICLDILTMSTETANTPYRGWTSAYTISSLLVQLESFLFEAVDKRGRGDKDIMYNSAVGYNCRLCGHYGGERDQIHPEITVFGSRAAHTTCVVATKVQQEEFFFLSECDNVVLEILLSYCDEETKTKIGHISLGDLKVLDRALARERYKCFYTLQRLGEDGVVLGIGAQTDIMPRRSRKTRRKTSQLQRLHPSFDFLSHDAYKEGVRNNIWKDREFDYFIPLYINPAHGKHALPLAEKCIVNLWTDKRITMKRPMLSPTTILETLSKMMSTTVVNIMKTCEDLQGGELQLFDSIKALEGFCSMHHLLLAFAQKYPAITQAATQKVQSFIENPLMRDKEVTPDIGELMISVALSNYTWDEFAPAWLEEGFIRNARWICAKYPNLLKVEDKSSCVRLTQSYDATRTGKRLAMFQRFFISEIASPARLKGDPNKNSILLKEYNKRMGLPAKGMAERLQAHSRKVIGCNNWWDYFALIDFCPPSHARLSAWLRNSLRISSIKDYHNESSILHFSESHITSPSERTHCDRLNCLCAGSLFKLPEDCKIVAGGPKPHLMQEKKTGIDICFVMDCTGSMSRWLQTAKQRIVEIMESVSTKAKGSVRFAIVGYRDHDSDGYGSDKWVLKEFDFTKNKSEAKRRVALFRVGGGGGYEATCCAMESASNMSWNREAHQIVVMIGDQPPHGFIGDRHYPKGCPCGSDTLRVVHTMKKNGIVVYPVDCGHTCGNRETFYHAVARITGGYAINLRESSLLPEIVFGACMEEQLMDKLSRTIAPVYDVCLKNHSGGRFEQHCRSVWAELNAKGIKVESCLPSDNYDTTIEHQVECLAFCTDMQQAKAMCENEYFVPINRTTKLCSYMERPITQGQVTKCMKRMKVDIAETRFLHHGCQYKSADRFTDAAFKRRWVSFRKKRGIKSREFAPWNKLTFDKKSAYAEIPDGEKIRRAAFARSGAMTSISSRPSIITRSMIGKKIQIKDGDKWTEVKIVSMCRGGKVRVLLADGFDQIISETAEWKKVQTAKGSPWAAKKAAPAPAPDAPEPKPIAAPTPVPVPAPQPVVAPAPAHSLRVPTMAKNVSTEVTEAVANNAVNHASQLPQQQPRRNLRNNSGQSDSGRSISRSISVDRSPPAPVPSQPTHKFVLGQIVSCKAKSDGQIYTGIVQNLQPLILKVDGFKDGRWRYCRAKNMLTEAVLLGNEFVFNRPEESATKIGQAAKGTKVQILEINGEFAHVISPFDGWVQIKKEEKQPVAAPTPSVQPIAPAQPQLAEEVLSRAVTIYRGPSDSSPAVGKLAAGTRIKIFEELGDFTHIVHPEEGFVRLATPSMSPEVLIETQRMLPTIECLVASGMSAKDLALACDFAGALPKKVSIKLINNRRVGVVGFEQQNDAQIVLQRGISHNNKLLLIKWSAEYLRENAL